MVKYSLDTNEREAVYFVLAGASILVSPLLNAQLSKLTQLNLVAPSTMMIFLFLIWVYSQFVWRVVSWIGLSGIPDLNGKYQGVMRRENEDDLKLEAIISQTWLKIDFIVDSKDTTGTTQAAALFIENTQQKSLKVIYSVKPTKALKGSSLYGEGLDDLRIRRVDKGHELNGLCYSSKLRSGEIVLRKV